MKKNLLIALALPAMFAACSQEDVLTEGQLQQGALLGTPAGKISFLLNEGVDSRMSWGVADGPSWSPSDQFSLFWVGDATLNQDANGCFKSATNALYQRPDDKSPFESQNVVYVGKHIIVYPADKTHYTDKEIVVKVGDVQDASVELGLRTVAVSDLITVNAPVSERQEGKMYAGYNEPVKADVELLSTNMVLKLNFALTANMESVKINKVEIVATDDSENPVNVFAKEGYLKEDANDHMSLYASGSQLTNTMTLNMPETAVVTKAQPSYTAQLALLPQSVASDTKFSIIVYTNYGKVTINKAKMVTNDSGKFQIEAGTNYDAAAAALITDQTALSFKAEFDDAAERTEDETSYGFRFARNVAVDMSAASITDWPVTNSTELVEAYAIYDLLEKEGEENFVLAGEKVNADPATLYNRFELTPAALEAIKAHEDVTLTIANTDTLVLVGEFEAVPELTEVISTTNHADVTLALGEGTEWALDMKNAKIYNSWKEIAVFGSLTISESAETADDEEALNKNIYNYGEVEFEGDVTMGITFTQAKGETTIPATSTVTINNASANAINGGTVNVEGTLIADLTSTVLNVAVDATVEVSGSLLQSNSAKINNAGTINIAETGAAIINDNLILDEVGSIVLASRTNSVKTSTNAGYIKFAYTGAEFKSESTDAFNYLILSGNVKINNTNLTIKNIEVAAGKTVEVTTNIESTDKLDNVFVGAGAKLRIPVGSEINTSKTNGAGNIEVYGTYVEGTVTDFTGKIFRFN